MFGSNRSVEAGVNAGQQKAQDQDQDPLPGPARAPGRKAGGWRGGRRAEGEGYHQIGRGATVEGTLRFSGRLELQGSVVGAVIADPIDGSELIVGPQGRVEGRIEAAVVLIAGEVQGPIRCSLRLDVRAGARVDGDIVYKDLQIQHGAIVQGSLQPIQGEQVALKLVANSRI